MGLRNEADQIRQRHRRRDRQRRNLVAVACFVNTSPYELIVQESIKSKEQLKGEKHRHQPHRQLLRRRGTSAAQGLGTRTGQGRADHSGRRLERARRRISQRQDRRLSPRRRVSSIWRRACRIGFSPAPRIFPSPIRFLIFARRRPRVIWRAIDPPSKGC